MNTQNNTNHTSSSTIEAPPSGRFVTTGVIDWENPPRHTGSMGSGGQILGGDIVVDLIIRDPYTGQTARFDSVKVTTGIGSLVTGIPADGICDVQCPSYDAFKRRDATGMIATPVKSNQVVQNQSLPQAVKVKDTIDNFSDSPGTVCKAYNENIEAAQRHLGLTHTRDDIQILQGKENGRSPGVVVNQRQGHVSLFGIDGKQNINVSQGSGVEMKTSSINTGSASQESTTMQYGGMPQMNNPVNTVIPQGTVVSPQPQTVPHVLKILTMVGTIVDMIDLVNACKDAVAVIRNTQGNEREEALDSIRSDAEGPGSFEKAYYGDKKKAEKAKDTFNTQGT